MKGLVKLLAVPLLLMGSVAYTGNSSNVYDIAASYIGVKAIAGDKNNKIIEGFYERVTGTRYSDEIAWCAAFVGSCLIESGYSVDSLPSNSAQWEQGRLLAGNYRDWGQSVYMVSSRENIDEGLKMAKKGDVVLVNLGGGKHVGFFDSFGAGYVSLLGGNQYGQVNVDSYDKNSVVAIRRAN